MGTTILYGLLAWVVGVICPQSGLDNPAVAPSSAAGDLEAIPTIATAHKLVKRPAEFFPADKKIRHQLPQIVAGTRPPGKVGPHKDV
jgi:hypothetical protein